MTALKPLLSILSVASLIAVLGMAPLPVEAAKKKEAAAEPTEPQPDYSKGFRKKAGDVQKDVTDKKWPEVMAGIAELEALPDLTRDDRRVILSWKFQAQQGSGDKEGFNQTLEAFLNEGFATPEQVGPMNQQLAAWYNAKKDMEKTLFHYQAYVEATPEPSSSDLITLGRLHLQTGNNAKGVEWLKRAASAAEAAGGVADEIIFQLLDRTYVDLGDTDGRLANLEELVKRYPKPEYYSRIVALYSQAVKDDRVVMLNLYRLAMRDVGLATVGEYLGYADNALVLGSPGEAERAMQKGMDAGVVPSVGTNQETLQESKAAVNRDRKDLPKDAQAAAKDPAGEFSVKVALGFYSLGDWEQAVSGVKAGLAKGGVKRLDDANLLLGASLVELGRLEEANAAFDAAAVAASDRYMKGIAGLWKGMVGRSQSPAQVASPEA
ncbi:MAG: tetratricopeptide repeat protein [Steroidobacteraceae bacterium]